MDPSWTVEGPSLLLSARDLVAGISDNCFSSSGWGKILCGCYVSVCHEEHAGLEVHRVIAAGPCDFGMPLFLFEPRFLHW